MTDSKPTLAETFRRQGRAVRDFLNRDLWKVLPEKPGARALYRLLRMGVLTVEGFVRSEVFLLSAALTYQVVFALVPLLAVMLAGFRAFGGLSGTGLADQLRHFLLNTLYMAPEKGDSFVAQLDAFIENVNAAAIGVVGFLVLLYTSLSLLHTIEKAFNKIYGIRSARTLFHRFGIYWILLTVGPLLVAASLAMSTFVLNHFLWLKLTAVVPLLGKAVLILAPFVFAWITFATLYVVMPNTQVDLRAAVVGALVAGTTWELMKTVYVWYNTQFVSSSKFYGALGAIPVFLLWIYLSWVIVLFGAEVAFAVQHVGTYVREIGGAKISASARDRLALVICVQAVKAFETGKPPPTAEAVAADLNTPVRVVHEIAFQLTTQEVLREVARKDSKDPGLIPGRDPALLSAQDVLRAVRSFGDPFVLPDGPQAEAVYRLVDEAESIAAGSLASRTLQDLARDQATGDRPQAAEGTPGPRGDVNPP